jgi:hypothetical protein
VLFFPRVAVIILQPLPPLPPYVLSSRAASDKVLSLFLSLEAGASSIPAPAPPAVSFFISEGVDLSTRTNPSFVSRLKFRMLASRTPVGWFSRMPCYRFPYFPVVAGVFSVLRYSGRLSSLSSDAAVPQHLGSLCHYCIQGLSTVFPLLFVISGFLILPGSWSIP